MIRILQWIVHFRVVSTLKAYTQKVCLRAFADWMEFEFGQLAATHLQSLQICKTTV